MTLGRRIQLAVLIGITAEILLAAPLFIPSSPGNPLPDWRLHLQVFQQPGASIVEQAYHHLYFDSARIKPLAARLPHLILDVARVVAMLIQAAIFALVTFGVIYVWQLRRPRTAPVS